MRLLQTSPRRAAATLALGLILVAAGGPALPGADALAAGPSCVGVHLAARWPVGPCDAVAAAGDTAWFANGADLEIVDYGTPAAPVPLARLTLPTHPADLALAGGRACLVGRSGRVYVIDAAAPPAYALVDSVDVVGARAVALGPRFAYVAGDSGLTVLDLDAPGGAASVADLPGPAGRGATLDGDRLLVAGDASGLWIYDLADPAAPVQDLVLPTPGPAQDVAVAGDLAHVACQSAGLAILAIGSNPGQLGLLSFYRGTAHDVSVRDGHAYVAVENALAVVDVSDPTAPRLVGQRVTADWARAVALGESWVFSGETGGGLVVLRISDPTRAPVVVARRPTGLWMQDVAVDAGHAFVADYGGELRILAARAGQGAMAELASLPLIGSPRGVAVADGRAYVACDYDGLEIVDVSDPAAPALLGSIDNWLKTLKVAVQGDLAFLACHGEGLRIVDVSDPAAPRELGGIVLGDDAFDVAVAGNLAYVAVDQAGLQIVDVSDPAHPVARGALDTYTNAFGVSVRDDAVYLTDGCMGLWSIDAGDPDAPVALSRKPPLDYARDVVVAGDFAYVADGQSLAIWDVTEPRAPLLTSCYGLGVRIDAVAVRQNLVFLATEDGGVWQLENTYVTPVVMRGLAAERRPEGIAVLWTLALPEPGARLQLWRQEGDGARVPVGEPLDADEGAHEVLDPDPPLGGCLYWVQETTPEGEEIWHGPAALPAATLAARLAPAVPNPFNPSTRLSFLLPRASRCRLEVFDAAGRRVAVLIDADLPAGEHEAVWHGRDDRGLAVPSGTYLSRLTTSRGALTGKLLLLR